MEQARRLKAACDSYIRRTLTARQFVLADFCAYMEPLFENLGYREDRGKRILVIRLDDVTDVVLTTGFWRELKAIYPDHKITAVVSPLTHPLMELCPYVDEVLEFAASPGTALQNVLEAAVLFCHRFLWRHRFSLCLLPRWDADESFALLLGYLSGARERIGYSEGVYPGKAARNPGYDALLTRPIMNPPQMVHEVERNFYLLQSLGYEVQDDSLEMWYDDQDKLTAHQLLRNFGQTQPLIVVGLGAKFARRRYPVAKYVAALKHIATAGARFVLLGGNDVTLEGRYFVGNMPRGSVINLIGQAYLRVMTAILAEASLYIGNDNGIAHMAAASQVPVIMVSCEAWEKTDNIGVYSRAERFFPWGVPTIMLRPKRALEPCRHTPFEGGCCTAMPHCITKVEPGEIVAAYNDMVDYLRGGRGA